MPDSVLDSKSRGAGRAAQAEATVTEAFVAAGWRIKRPPEHSQKSPDLVVRKKQVAYAVEIKSASEGRSDRLIPLWSQACLQSVAVARDGQRPLAIVAAPRIARSAAEQVVAFAREYAPDAAVAIIDFEGLRVFRGEYLDGLDSAGERRAPAVQPLPSGSADLFSDLNQWLLKVLLAPNLPEELLSAPRERYRNASHLAGAAQVSVMSAFRFVELLRRDGYLHESAGVLELVRREELLRNWQVAVGAKRVPELPMRFPLRGDPRKQLRRVLHDAHACLALFAAADALNLGFVHGVPPYVYLERLRSGDVPILKRLVAAQPGESPDVILRQAPAPRSVFRGAVRAGDVLVSDVLQVWLDVASHPSRGAEQVDLIRRRALSPIVGGKSARG